MRIQIDLSKSLNGAGFDCEIVDEFGGGHVESGKVDDLRNLIALVVEENLIRITE